MKKLSPADGDLDFVPLEEVNDNAMQGMKTFSRHVTWTCLSLNYRGALRPSVRSGRQHILIPREERIHAVRRGVEAVTQGRLRQGKNGTLARQATPCESTFSAPHTKSCAQWLQLFKHVNIRLASYQDPEDSSQLVSSPERRILRTRNGDHPDLNIFIATTTVSLGLVCLDHVDMVPVQL